MNARVPLLLCLWVPAAVGAEIDAWRAACDRLPDDARVYLDLDALPGVDPQVMALTLGISLADFPPETDRTARIERARMEGASHYLALFGRDATGSVWFCRETNVGRHLTGRYGVASAGLRHVLVDLHNGFFDGFQNDCRPLSNVFGPETHWVAVDLATIAGATPAHDFNLVPPVAVLRHALRNPRYRLAAYQWGVAVLAPTASGEDPSALEGPLGGRLVFAPRDLQRIIGEILPAEDAPFGDALVLLPKRDARHWAAVATTNPLPAGKYECVLDLDAPGVSPETPLIDMLVYASGTTRLLASKRFVRTRGQDVQRCGLIIGVTEPTAVDVNAYYLREAPLRLLGAAVFPQADYPTLPTPAFAVQQATTVVATTWTRRLLRLDTKAASWPSEATQILDLAVLGLDPLSGPADRALAERVLGEPGVGVAAMAQGRAVLCQRAFGCDPAAVREALARSTTSGPADWTVASGELVESTTAPQGRVLALRRHRDADGIAVVWRLAGVGAARMECLVEWTQRSPQTNVTVLDLELYLAGASTPFAVGRILGTAGPGVTERSAVPFALPQAAAVDVVVQYRRGADVDLRLLAVLPDAFFVPLRLAIEGEDLGESEQAIVRRDNAAHGHRALRLAGIPRPLQPALVVPLGRWPATDSQWRVRLRTEAPTRDGTVLWVDLWDEKGGHPMAQRVSAAIAGDGRYTALEWRCGLVAAASLTLTLDHNAHTPVLLDDLAVDMPATGVTASTPD